MNLDPVYVDRDGEGDQIEVYPASTDQPGNGPVIAVRGTEVGAEDGPTRLVMVTIRDGHALAEAIRTVTSA